MKPVLLIVDDEKSTRSVLCAALEDDYEVYPAANCKAARAILETEPVDLLLTDLRLGGEMVSFNVDDEFGSTFDCLVLVDLTKAPDRLMTRYCGTSLKSTC